MFRHTASLINGFMVVVGGSGHNDTAPSLQKIDESDCFSKFILSFDTGKLERGRSNSSACRKWVDRMPTSDTTEMLRRYGHTAASNEEHIFVFGGFNGVMLNDILVFTPGSGGG